MHSLLLKTCMLEVSRTMRAEQTQRAEQPDSMEDRLGVLLYSLRRLEVQGSLNWLPFAAQVPDMAVKVCHAAWAHSPHMVLTELRVQVAQVAKECVKKDIEELQRDLPELEKQEAGRIRGQIMRKLVKLVPGRGSAVTTIQLAERLALQCPTGSRDGH
jgi:hypothetical protein